MLTATAEELQTSQETSAVQSARSREGPQADTNTNIKGSRVGLVSSQSRGRTSGPGFRLTGPEAAGKVLLDLHSDPLR